MKKIMFLMTSLLLTLLFTSCEEKSWADGEFKNVEVWSVVSKLGSYYYYPTEGYLIIETSNSIVDVPMSDWKLVDNAATTQITAKITIDERNHERHEVVFDKTTERGVFTINHIENGTTAVANVTMIEKCEKLIQIK